MLVTAELNETAKSACCREHGLAPQELEQCRQSATQVLAAPEEARASRADTKADGQRIKTLSRELRCKDQALQMISHAVYQQAGERLDRGTHADKSPLEAVALNPERDAAIDTHWPARIQATCWLGSVTAMLTCSVCVKGCIIDLNRS